MASERKKQVLCIASVASNLDNFSRINLDILLSLGCEVTLASNFHSSEDINSQEKTDDFAREMRAKGVHIVHIDFARSLKKAGMQVKSVLQVRSLLKREFDLIHCHSPICAVIVRVLAQKYRRKNGTKVFYTAHGFHFFCGAPKKNWLFFYPAERALAGRTDVLITINHEDHKRAVRQFHARKVVYMPGIGIDTEKFKSASPDRNTMRTGIGIRDDDIMLLSVGELNRNKNHKDVIMALGKIRESGCGISSRLHYCIAGIGGLRDELAVLAEKMGVCLHLLGFRNDIADIMSVADIFIHPSKREGLPVALMEAMAAGLPAVVTDIRGNTDLIRNGMEGYVIDPEREKLESAILSLAKDREQREYMGRNACIRIQKFSAKRISRMLLELYSEALQ